MVTRPHRQDVSAASDAFHHELRSHHPTSPSNACSDWVTLLLYEIIGEMNFWQELPKPFFALAPMEAVTDVVFRHVVTRAGRPDIFFTEFTNATGWYRAGDKAIGGRLVKTDDENLIVAQLWGSDPLAMSAMAKHCATLGYDGIDINMGCPDQSAIKGGGGAYMIRNPGRAYAMIAAAKESGLPVSVKTRLGYTRIDEWYDWLSGLLAQDIAALTIHLRTKKEMSKVPAHFELIPEIKKLRDEIAPDTALIINGDIRDRAHGLELYEHYGIDGIMIGRGIFQNPYCFKDIESRADISGQTVSTSPDKLSTDSRPTEDRSTEGRPAGRDESDDDLSRHEEVCLDEMSARDDRFELLHFHLDEFDKYQDMMGRPFETLKRFFKIYIRDFDGAAELRDQLMQTKSTDEVRAILEKLD